MAWATGTRYGADVFIFGSGSNVLVGDGGFRGVAIENHHTAIEGPAQNGAGYKVRAGSGVSFATLARRVSGAGYAGIEWACGIPGSLGGAVVTNAGAYDHALSDVLVAARLGNERGEVIELTPAELSLSYRNSAFTRGKLKDEIVLSVDLRVQQGDAEALKAQVREFDRQRKAAQPPGRNCGSVFKNPPGRSAWELVDAAGLRGHRIGNAQISELHSNFILNLGDAAARDVVALIRLAQERVREQTGTRLETEVMFIGEFS
jgi:UDP-N-acetylmuramate dehydrogenase